MTSSPGASCQCRAIAHRRLPAWFRREHSSPRTPALVYFAVVGPGISRRLVGARRRRSLCPPSPPVGIAEEKRFRADGGCCERCRACLSARRGARPRCLAPVSVPAWTLPGQPVEFLGRQNLASVPKDPSRDSVLLRLTGPEAKVVSLGSPGARALLESSGSLGVQRAARYPGSWADVSDALVVHVLERVSPVGGMGVVSIAAQRPRFLRPPPPLPPFSPCCCCDQVKGASMWARLGGVHVAGWILSILSTAAVAKAAKVTSLEAARAW